MSATDTIARHYEALDGAERFVAVMEAMARGDEAEDRRLDDACPRVVCEVDDPAYRGRLSMSFTAAAIACASVQRDLDVLRTLEVVRDVSRVFRDGAAEGADDAFWAGWFARDAAGGGTAAAKGEDDEAEGSVTLPPDAVAELARLRAHAVLPLDVAVRAVRRTVGTGRAASLLSAWEGLGRFTKGCCGVEPLVLTKAWRLLTEDPEPEVRGLYPKATVDENLAANWHASLAGPWAKRAGAY